MDIVKKLLQEVELPRMLRVRQHFSRPFIAPADIPAAIAGQLRQERFAARIHPGMRVAITAGSRGVANVAIITRAVVDFCLAAGAKPFIVPAMGSHGGATAEGQAAVLASYGITDAAMGCPILSSMDTVPIGQTDDGHPVHIDRNAAGADAIILCCRIKPHTAFRGPYESGIMKMMTIGLGKQHGAEICHEAGFGEMARLVPLFGRVIRDNAPIAFAVAAVENAYDETAFITALEPQQFDEEEPKLLKTAFSLMPRIFFDSCDVLIVDEIGKDISGDGMDPNVTGTFCTPYASGGIAAQRVCVLSLTAASHGNANGMGMADAITSRFWQQVDLGQSYPNAITSTVLAPVKIPPIMPSDADAIRLCLKTANAIDRRAPRIVRIKNTLQLGSIEVSEAMRAEAEAHSALAIESEAAPLVFDTDGNLF